MLAQDIEIYIKGANNQAIDQWLNATFVGLETLAQNNKQTRYLAHWQGESFNINILSNVSDGFTSVWFNHFSLPWADDMECAEAAFVWITKNQTSVEGLRIRCILGGWQETQPESQEAEAWLELTLTGKQPVVW